MLFQTEEQRELNVVRDTSGITKRQVVSVGISYETVFDNIYIPHYKKNCLLFSIPFEIFFICYILAFDKGYNGQNCNAICSFPTYGLDCQSIFNCTETFCDPVDGCTGHTT